MATPALRRSAVRRVGNCRRRCFLVCDKSQAQCSKPSNRFLRISTMRCPASAKNDNVPNSNTCARSPFTSKCRPPQSANAPRSGCRRYPTMPEFSGSKLLLFIPPNENGFGRLIVTATIRQTHSIPTHVTCRCHGASPQSRTTGAWRDAQIKSANITSDSPEYATVNPFGPMYAIRRRFTGGRTGTEWVAKKSAKTPAKISQPFMPGLVSASQGMAHKSQQSQEMRQSKEPRKPYRRPLQSRPKLPQRSAL